MKNEIATTPQLVLAREMIADVEFLNILDTEGRSVVSAVVNGHNVKTVSVPLSMREYFRDVLIPAWRKRKEGQS